MVGFWSSFLLTHEGAGFIALCSVSAFLESAYASCKSTNKGYIMSSQINLGNFIRNGNKSSKVEADLACGKVLTVSVYKAATNHLCVNFSAAREVNGMLIHSASDFFKNYTVSECKRMTAKRLAEGENFARLPETLSSIQAEISDHYA